MADTYYPREVQDAAIAGVEESGKDNSKTSYDTSTYTPVQQVDKKYPPKIIARETLSSSLDTRAKRIKGEYAFTKEGSIVIGGYVAGVSGEIAISPDGIVATNVNGTTTVSIDGTTGDAFFAGTIQAGAVVAGAVDVGNGSIVLDGPNNRIVIYDNTPIPRIVMEGA